MKILKVKLKQHTPLVHFQHDQYGATLRASEVKPLLDKYIVSREFKNDYEQCKYYLIGYKFSKLDQATDRIDEEEKLNGKLRQKFLFQNYRALNYKLKISTTTLDESFKLEFFGGKTKFNPKTRKEETKYFNEDYPLILSNMGGKNSKDELLNFSYAESVDLFFSIVINQNNQESLYCSKLKEILSKYISLFFANTNWGQRSTKGFGSFAVVDIDNIPQEWNHGNLFLDGTPFMKYELRDIDLQNDMKVLFSVIDFYWKCLKSGINCTRREITNTGVIRKNFERGDNSGKRYIKAYLWEYLNNKLKNYTWEKRKIKEELNLIGSPTLFDLSPKPNMHIPFFARGLMGCPTDSILYRIPTGRKGSNGKEVFEQVSVNLSNANINDRNDKIERIASPIMFKPVFRNIDNHKWVYIYILFNQDLIDKLNEEASNFKFKFVGNGRFTEIDLKPKDFNFDYKDLIKNYHWSFYSNKDLFESIFMLPFSKRLKEHQFKMIARDFSWNNLLGRNNGESLISFGVTKLV